MLGDSRKRYDNYIDNEWWYKNVVQCFQEAWTSVNPKPFLDARFFVSCDGESDRRLLDVEVKNLCVIAAFPKKRLSELLEGGLKITWTSLRILTRRQALPIHSHMWFTIFSMLHDLWFSCFIVLWCSDCNISASKSRLLFFIAASRFSLVNGAAGTWLSNISETS